MREQVPKLTKRQDRIYRMIKHFAKGSDRLQFTQEELAKEAGLSANVLRAELKKLNELGWLEVRTKPRRGTLCVIKDPHDERLGNDLPSIELKTKKAAFSGEALLMAILDLIVDETRYEQPSRPSFLKRPGTGQLLEYDRFYEEHRVAIEFNGSQHQTDPEQMDRDLIKKALSHQHRIKLLIFTVDDLKVETIFNRLTGVMPLRRVGPSDPRVIHLDKACDRYRNKVEEEVWKENEKEAQEA